VREDLWQGHNEVMLNRLARETSPYLRQHEENPIDWYPWGDEAFARAANEDRPIFLSVGYSSCHWCHVMAHESFEDSDVAEHLNRDFVSVKVDREERPDVDEAYMTAVQLSSGRGGWPMTLFLTPDRKPFFAGTYFPRDDRNGHPGFLTLVQGVAHAWQTRRAELIEAADTFTQALREALGAAIEPRGITLNRRFVDDAIEALHGDFDPDFGGFGGAPKFPPHSAIAFLLDASRRPAGLGAHLGVPDLADQARTMASTTLEKIVLGGIHDHVGGGFHRYSTDDRWFLPHFEKMLSDNALLLKAFARAKGLDPRTDALFARAGNGIVDWLKREMTSPEGLFFAALDADSDGEEGLFYLWSLDDIRDALSGPDPAFEAAFGLREEGNYFDEATRRRTGLNVLARTEDGAESFDRQLSTLRSRRAIRERPRLDEKAIAAWNGMAIRGLVEFGEVALARRCAEAWLEAERQFGRLPHQVVHGEPSGLAFLDDYAFLVDGFVALGSATGSPLWHDHARIWIGEIDRGFSDRVHGGFFATSGEHEALFGRTKPFTDGATPSANATLASGLVELGETTSAMAIVRAGLGWMQRAPLATESLYEVLARCLDGREPLPRIAVEEFAGRSGATLWLFLDEGSLTYADPAPPGLEPVRVTADGPVEVRFPESEDGVLTGAIPIRVAWRPDSRPGILDVTFQVCTAELCELPQTHSVRLAPA